jgi:hypothetical protein
MWTFGRWGLMENPSAIEGTALRRIKVVFTGSPCSTQEMAIVKHEPGHIQSLVSCFEMWYFFPHALCCLVWSPYQNQHYVV